MHPVLARQLRRLGVDPDRPPEGESKWRQLLQGMSDYYETVDLNRNTLEHSLMMSSQEVATLHDAVREISDEKVERSDEHYHNLFERNPIPTWEEDFSAVATWLEALRLRGVEDLEQHFADHPADLSEVVILIEVTNVNTAACRLVGADDEATLLGSLEPGLLNDDSAPSFIAQLKAMWETEDCVKFPLVGCRLDGERFDGLLEWHVPRISGRHDYSRVLVTIVDITEQKAAERRAFEALKSRDEFLASISHELRTPLTSVLGFAEVLRSMESDDYDEERDSLLGIIAGQAADLYDLVEDLLAAARSELGQLSVVAVPVDVHAQIAQVLEARSVDDAEVLVPLRPSRKVLAHADPQRVRQILRNLVTNADRYGGTEIEIRVEQGQDQIMLKVRDNGEGLHGEDRDKVFERYYRSPKDEGQPGSVGLGLTISRDLARRMGGDLIYRSVDGWSSFELTLPSHTAKTDQRQPSMVSATRL